MVIVVIRMHGSVVMFALTILLLSRKPILFRVAADPILQVMKLSD